MVNNVAFLLIGAGPASLMAGIFAARQGLDCLILEKGPQAGRKLALSGGGRGNFCNLRCWSDPACFSRPEDARRLRRMDLLFPVAELRDFMAGLGLPSKVEDNGRVFPQSDKASDLRDRLEKAYLAAGGRLLFNKNVIDIKPPESCSDGSGADSAGAHDQLFRLCCQDGSVYTAEQVLLATGGASFPRCGSDGSCLTFFQRLGLDFRPFTAALVPLRLKNKFPPDLAGLSLEKAALYYVLQKPGEKKKQVIERSGPVLWQKDGLSGPLILNCSADLYDKERLRDVRFSLLPETDSAGLSRTWAEKAVSQAKRPVRSYLREILPKRLADYIWSETGFPLELNFASLSKKQMAVLNEALLARPLIPGPAPSAEHAMASRGGLAADEINWRTMEVRRYPGLYAAGECLDIDFISGGFHLCFAFQSGRLAAESVVTGRRKS